MYSKQNVKAFQQPTTNLYQKLRSELLFNSFYKMFDVVHADTPELLEEAHRLRYQVFCVENKGYEDPSAHPDGMEKDSYDDRSAHALLVYKPFNKAIGTVRVIYPNMHDLENSFPLQALNSSPALHDESFIRNGCELSRLCMSREYRRQVRDDVMSRAQSSVRNLQFINPFMSKIALKISALGLIRGGFELALKKNLMNCYGVMEPFHLSKLVQAGLVHKVLGPNIEYHGQRTPFMCNILEVYDDAIMNNPESWNIVSVKGANHKLAKSLLDKKTGGLN